MHLICGLGNPGRKYAHTRHNIGFMAIEGLIARFGKNGESFSRKFGGEYLQVRSRGADFIALMPQTFMNLSGECFRDIINYFKIPHENALIICDDVNLPFGKLRIRQEGSDGGHNGLKSIFSLLGTSKLARMRIGVGSPERVDMADYVLSRFSVSEAENLSKTLDFAVKAAEMFIEKGIGPVMNGFNNKFGFQSAEKADETSAATNKGNGEGEKNEKPDGRHMTPREN